jgi:hypothetical protein
MEVIFSSMLEEKDPKKTVSRLTANPHSTFFHSDFGKGGRDGDPRRDHMACLTSDMWFQTILRVCWRAGERGAGWICSTHRGTHQTLVFWFQVHFLDSHVSVPKLSHVRQLGSTIRDSPRERKLVIFDAGSHQAFGGRILPHWLIALETREKTQWQ